MGRRTGGDREGGPLKKALLVAGGLVLGWLTIETAFKPFLDRLRDAISGADPARDPDDDLAEPSGEVKPPIEEEEKVKKEKDASTHAENLAGSV